MVAQHTVDEAALLGGVDGCGVARMCGAGERLFIALADGTCGRTAEAQPGAQNRLQRKETNHQREGKSQDGREEVAHERTPAREEQSMLQPATERTVKVHQSGPQKALRSLFLKAICHDMLFRRVSGQHDANTRSFRLLTQSLRAGEGSVHTSKRAASNPDEP